MIGMEAPKFVKCPECDGKYNDKKKRRIIDSCGHPRCFSCLVLDNQCTVCETILNRRISWKSSCDSLLDDNQDGSKSIQSSTHESFSKEQYLRRLYSYDPESSEQITRRGSLDLHTRRLQNRRTKLGQHSSSALVLSNEIQNSSPTLKRIGSPRRNSLQEFLFPRKISVEDMQIFNSSPNNENLPKAKEPSDDNGSTSQVISPRSSGYWSEKEYSSDQEGNVPLKSNIDLDDNNKTNTNTTNNDNNKIINNNNGNNNSSENDRKENSLLQEDMESTKKRNGVFETTKKGYFYGETASKKEMNENAQNTKEILPEGSARTQGRIRQNAEPDWRKYFDNHSNVNNLRVTNL